MPSRDPSYYRWSQDKPVTTNQTYGFGLTKQSSTSSASGATERKCKNTSCHTVGSGSDDDGYHHHSCVQCPDCAWSSRRHDGQLCPRHRPRQKTITPSVNRFSSEPAVKPINKGYMTGQEPITHKLKKVGKSSAPAGVQLQQDVSSSTSFEYHEQKGKDLYLWHALSGSLVHCKHHDSTVQN
jgi:hypothetical protein